jgi:hypothetical protein
MIWRQVLVFMGLSRLRTHISFRTKMFEHVTVSVANPKFSLSIQGMGHRAMKHSTTQHNFSEICLQRLADISLFHQEVGENDMNNAESIG